MAKLKSTDIYGNLLVQGKTVLGVDATKDGKQIATEEYVDSEIETISLTPGPPGTNGTNGKGWTGVTYNNTSGTLTFASNDGLGYTTSSIKGSKGDTGPAPEHGWSGTQLRFKNPNGTWGSYVNLKGTDGTDANVTKVNVMSAGAVMTTEDQSISGTKTFVGDTTIGGLKITGATKHLLGTNTEVTDFQSRKVWFSEGALFYGTAAAAGLLTRGISGINQAGSSKDNLYINYDGDNTYRTNRHLILQAGTPGTHYGNNLYQYAAARGGAVKDWVEAKNYLTSSALSGYATETFVNEKYNVVSQTYGGQSTISFQASHAFKTILSYGLIEKYKIEDDSTYNFPIGTEITVIQMDTTEVEFTMSSVVTLRSVESKRKIAARYQAVTAKKIAANDWILIGALK